MSLLKIISETFWTPKVWLPPNTTWDDIAPGSRPDVQHADYRDLIWPLPLAVGMIILRYVVERYWVAPIGRHIGIRSTRPKRAAPNPILEEAYNSNTRLRHKRVLALSKQVDLTERQIERWWRQRRAQDKPTTLVKFCENSWRFLYYTYSFIYGVIILWDTPWFWDVTQCWYGYPHQSVTRSVWWYYMISMSFYWALTVSQFFDIKRKDFWQMFVHHMVTLALLSFSWVCNLHRVGSLVLVCHDCADIFLEGAKITKYAKYQKICDAIFAIFIVVWMLSRLVYYPRIIYSSSVEAPRILPMFPAYYIFNSLLVALLALHLVWTYMILKIAETAIKKGQMDGDIRSSSSDVTVSSAESNQPLTNGNRTSEMNNGGTPKKTRSTVSASQ